jgi:hypothetical protein
MKKSKILILVLAAGLLSLIGNECKKDSTTSAQYWNSNSVEKTSVNSLNTFDQLNSLADMALSANNLKSLRLGDCPVITLNISQLPYTLTFDWGSGCTGNDGITRIGMITLSISGMMDIVGKTATFTFTDFYADGNKITGVHTITYAGLNAGNNWPRFDVHTDAEILFPDNKTIIYKSDNSRLMAEGSGTASLTDDVWHIIGTAHGTTREGIDWTAAITNDVVKRNTCKWFESGTLTATPDGGIARTVDFGDGTCDNKATLTIGNTNINVEM